MFVEERDKPVTVQDYLSWPAPEKSLDVILKRLHDNKDGAERILSERRRQVSKEGWTTERDESYVDGQLIVAAKAYMNADPFNSRTGWGGVGWPWTADTFKSTTKIRNLEKAGALIAAEIDRLLRLERNDTRNTGSH